MKVVYVGIPKGNILYGFEDIQYIAGSIGWYSV